jgi:hypothetical protein
MVQWLDAGPRTIIFTAVSRILLVFAAVTITCVVGNAGPLGPAIQSTDEKGRQLLHVALAEKKDGKPKATFSTEMPKIYALWKGEALQAGDRIRAVWIAEDVGNVAPKDSKITESFVTAEKSDDDGAFGLARPTDGWPVGKYRLEIYVGDKLAEALKFTIQPGVTIELH